MVVTLATDTFLRPFGKTCFRFHFLNVALNVHTGLMIRIRWNFCWKSTFQNFWFYSEQFCNGNKKCFYCSFDDYLWWRAEGFAADFQFGEGKNSNKRDADNFLNHEARIFTKRETKQWQETRGVDFLTMTLSCAKVETTAVQNNAPALRSTYEILINNGATHCSYPKWKEERKYIYSSSWTKHLAVPSKNVPQVYVVVVAALNQRRINIDDQVAVLLQ